MASWKRGDTSNSRMVNVFKTAIYSGIKTLYGYHKYRYQDGAVRRAAYRLLGEVHIPARIRAGHALRFLRREGLLGRNSLRYLDAGSGKGDMAFHLASLNPTWRVKGVELDASKVERCRALAPHYGLHNVEFMQGNLLDLLFENNFDLITSMDVLEHIEDDQRVLKNFHQALAHGGTLILTFPSDPQYPHLKWVSVRDRRKGISLQDSGHLRTGYHPHSIRRKLQQEGFADIDVRYTFGWPGTRAFDIFFLLGDSNPNPILFFICLPLLLILGRLDLVGQHQLGSALIVKAVKPR